MSGHNQASGAPAQSGRYAQASPGQQRLGPPFASLFPITAHVRFAAHPLLKYLRRSTISLREHQATDFVTTSAVVVLLEVSQLAAGTVALRQAMDRLRSAQQPASGRKAFFALLFYESAHAEPPLDTLTFVNEACIEASCTLMLCRSWPDAAAHLEAIAGSSSVSGDILHRPKSDNPREAVISGLLETGKVNVSDARRLVNRHVTVSELLQCTPTDLAREVQGLGVRKATGLAAVLHAPFPTRRLRLDEIPTPSTTGVPASGVPTQQHSDALALALARIDEKGDESDASDSDSPLIFSALQPG